MIPLFYCVLPRSGHTYLPIYAALCKTGKYKLMLKIQGNTVINTVIQLIVGWSTIKLRPLKGSALANPPVNLALIILVIADNILNNDTSSAKRISSTVFTHRHILIVNNYSK